MIVLVECGREALLARAEHLMASGPALTEMPVISLSVDGTASQGFTQHDAAADNVTGLDACTHIGPSLVAMGTGLPDKQKHSRVGVMLINRKRPMLK